MSARAASRILIRSFTVTNSGSPSRARKPACFFAVCLQFYFYGKYTELLRIYARVGTDDRITFRNAMFAFG